MNRLSILRHWQRNEEGATALEFAIVATAFIVVAIGILEFGRALQVRNEMAFAIDRGARELVLNAEVDEAAIRAAIMNSFNSYSKDKLSIQFSDDSSEAITVELSYPLEMFIPGFTGTLNVTLAPRRLARI
jgi:Flp pilus assembly protein TadG